MDLGASHWAAMLDTPALSWSHDSLILVEARDGSFHFTTRNPGTDLQEIA